MLFGSVAMFILIFAVQLIYNDKQTNLDADKSEYWKVTPSRKLFTAISVFITAYQFQ